MTIPRNDTRAAEPSTKKTIDLDRFHKLFLVNFPFFALEVTSLFHKDKQKKE